MTDIQVSVLLIISSLTSLVTIISLLAFFFAREKEQLLYKKHLEVLVTNIPQDIQSSYNKILESRDKLFVKGFDKTFALYLKHIQALEKMALPKPITTKMVRDVMDRDIEGGGEYKNEIEKEEEDSVPVTESNLAHIINSNPKIEFEGPDDIDIPTVIE